MTFTRLLLRNLVFHWRGNLAVLLGVVVGTAVLTGALLVGDSLRGSLRDVTLQQLGNIDQVLVANRLFREELADALAQEDGGRRVAPALIFQGAVTTPGTKEAPRGTRAGRVTILGVDHRFWQLWPNGRGPGGDASWPGKDDLKQAGVVLNAALARDLGVKVGGDVILHLQRVSAIPRESLLGRPNADDAVQEVKLPVRAILPDDAPGSRFNLHPGPTVPRNAFVPLAALQKELLVPRPDQPPLHLRRPINALLVEGVGDLQPALKKHLTLDDWGLVLLRPQDRATRLFQNLDRNRNDFVDDKEWPRLKDADFAAQLAGGKKIVERQRFIRHYREQHPYLSLESRGLFVEDAVAVAAKGAAAKVNLRDAPTLVYLADSVRVGGEERMSYTVIAALDAGPDLPPVLGGFLPAGWKGLFGDILPGPKHLKENQIVFVNWPGTPLSPSSKVEKVVLTYYDSEEPDRLRQTPRPLDVVGWIDLKGAADDPGLTPEFPGITDRPSPRNWDPPPSLHYDKKRVTDADERYWQRFRTTPKAYVSLATGQSLWGSRFGKLTSIRLAPPVGKAVDLDEAAKKFEQALLHHLVPEKGGLVFDAIRERALRASSGGTDFGKLFLYFSVFLIVAALLLVGLLFRLNLDRRASEIGVLLATGVPRGTVRRLWLVEGLSLAALGALFGSLGAIGYAGLLLDYLRASWPGGIDASFLRLHGTFTSYAIGYFSALLVSGLTIVWATWVLGRVSPRALLGGETAETVERASGPRGTKLRLIVAGVCLAGAVACLVAGPSVSDHELQAMTFFSSGFLLLIAGMIGVWSLLSRKRLGESRSVFALAMRNAGRHPVRSLLTVGLLASATFLIVAVQSFHRAAGEDFARRDGGSGGFTLFGESEVPLFLELQSQRAQDDLDFALRLANVKEAEKEALRGVESYSFRLRAGDDASCLNLAQPRRPRVLGVSQSFIERGGFRFQSNEGGRQYQKTPWRMLELDTFAIEGAIPVIADATTAKWMLKTGLGEELTVPAENGELVRLRIVGLLQDSIFQSELLMSEANFRKLYPRQGGYQFFLIDAPAEKASQVRELLETGLAGHGLTVLPTRQRVEAYLAVENTYLATFQALGGLGLLLGALGLAVVLLRSVWERRAELALLRALGFRRATLGRLILAENSYLLTLGLGVGLAAALLSVLPHLLEGTGRVVVLRLLALLAGVLLAGLMAGAAAVAATLRAPLLPALRRE